MDVGRSSIEESRTIRIMEPFSTVDDASFEDKIELAIAPAIAIKPTTTSSIIEIQKPAIAPSIEMKKFFNIVVLNVGYLITDQCVK